MSDLMEILLNIQRDVSETKAEVKALSGDHGRVTAIEKQLATQSNREWVKVVVVVPLIAIVHAVCRKLGIDI